MIQKIIKTIDFSILTIVEATDRNPLSLIVIVFFLWCAFDLLEMTIEKLISGHHFAHWLDPIFQVLFIGYAAYGVFWCAALKAAAKQSTE